MLWSNLLSAMFRIMAYTAPLDGSGGVKMVELLPSLITSGSLITATYFCKSFLVMIPP